eukprot:780224-Heterocapsa_arctica.AAC.1
MNLFQLRYHHGSIRASSSTDILSCAGLPGGWQAAAHRCCCSALWGRMVDEDDGDQQYITSTLTFRVECPKRVSSLLPSGWSVPPWVKHVTR